MFKKKTYTGILSLMLLTAGLLLGKAGYAASGFPGSLPTAFSSPDIIANDLDIQYIYGGGGSNNNTLTIKSNVTPPNDGSFIGIINCPSGCGISDVTYTLQAVLDNSNNNQLLSGTLTISGTITSLGITTPVTLLQASLTNFGTSWSYNLVSCQSVTGGTFKFLGTVTYANPQLGFGPTVIVNYTNNSTWTDAFCPNNDFASTQGSPADNSTPADYGDAPDTSSGVGTGNYNTTANDNGPYHLIGQPVYLGSVAPDSDSGLLQNNTATADDTTGIDDEDGIPTLPMILTTSTSVSMTVNVTNTTGSPATLACWIDFNGNGVFEPSISGVGEQQTATVNSIGFQTKTLTFTPTAAPSAGITYIRCRISTDPTWTANPIPTGPANNGEVEDYAVSIPGADYGDAPDTSNGTATGNYQTTATDNGPSHIVGQPVYLGIVAPDVDSGLLQNNTATADDTTGIDDEDGIPILPTILTSSTSVPMTVNATNTTGSPATLACWIDFNRNGSFLDAGEGATIPVPNGSSNTPFVLTFTPSAAPSAGVTYIRCRITTQTGWTPSPTGPADNGEVEDYSVTINAVPSDYSDAPASYSNNISSLYDPPNHAVSNSSNNLPRLGALTDTEAGPFPGPGANGDNLNNLNDEDGVTSSLIFTEGGAVSVTVNVTLTNPAQLACWMDFNQNGTFEASEKVTQAAVNGVNTLNFTPLTFPTGSSGINGGVSYLRCRIATNAGDVTNPTGAAADGEVEDYRVTIIPTQGSSKDYGDAPDTSNGTATGNYNTTANDNGPSHVIGQPVYLGTISPDADSGLLQNNTATADDITAVPDEDGIAPLDLPTILTTSTSVKLKVTATNTTGNSAILACWIDFNRDGVFGDTPGEKQTATVNSSPSLQTINLTFIPSAAPVAGVSYIRCRITTDWASASNATPVGAVSNGEVEDYEVNIYQPCVLAPPGIQTVPAAPPLLSGATFTVNPGGGSPNPISNIASVQCTLSNINPDTGVTFSPPASSGPSGSNPYEWTFSPNPNAVTITVRRATNASASGSCVVQDSSGNVCSTDPGIEEVVRVQGQPVTVKVNNGESLPPADHYVKIQNGSATEAGLTQLEISVNGTKFKLTAMRDNTVYLLDIGPALQLDKDNFVTLTAKGRPGGTAVVVFSDAPPR